MAIRSPKIAEMNFIETINQIDGNFLIGIQRTLNADWLTPIMKGFTYLAENGVVLILFCIVLMCIKKTRRLGIMCAASLALAFTLCKGVIKPIVFRTRPWEALQDVQQLMPDPGDSSFPSGHATSSMATAFALWLNTRKGEYRDLHRWGWVAIVLALMIGLSRVYLGLHYPSDVIVGLLLGVAGALIVYTINIKLEAKNGKINVR